MSLLDLLHEIKTNTLQNFYIFTGEENTIRSIYTEQIVKIAGGNKVVLDNVVDVFSKIRSVSLLHTRTIFIVYNDKDIVSNYDKYNELLASLNDNVLILILDKLDKRGKFYTQFKDNVVEFDKLTEEQIVSYIQQDSSLSTKYAQALAQLCDNSYGRAMLELDKVKHFSEVKNISHDTALRSLVEEDVIRNLVVDDNIGYSFTNAVVNRERIKALELLKDCRAADVNSLMLISLLYSSFRVTLQVQTYTGNDLEKATGISSKQAFVVKKRCGKYSVQELLNALETIRKIETSIKNGTIDENISLEYLLVSIL